VRALRQWTDSKTGLSTTKPIRTAVTLNAEANSQPNTVGVHQLEATQAALSSVHYPGAMSRVATRDAGSPAMLQAGGSTELPIAAWGTVAVSSTINGATAIAGSEAMPLAVPAGTPGASRGTTMTSFNPMDIKGSGATGQVCAARSPVAAPAAPGRLQPLAASIACSCCHAPLAALAPLTPPPAPPHTQLLLVCNRRSRPRR
jgi:hypothetical protein